MPKQLEFFSEPLASEYLRLTREELPRLARLTRSDWPVCEDHCFQRIVLDTVCGGVWYDHLAQPAYKQMTHEQLHQAICLCHKILANKVDLDALNAQSLAWPGKSRI